MRTLFIIPLLLMSLVLVRSAVYADNNSLMKSLEEISLYSDWYPFFQTSLSVVVKTMLTMSVIWIGYWFYCKRETLKRVFIRISKFFGFLEDLLLIGGLLATINIFMFFIAFIPAVLMGYFIDEFVGVVVGVVTLTLFTLPVGRKVIIEVCNIFTKKIYKK